jgi:hypothetical protein
VELLHQGLQGRIGFAPVGQRDYLKALFPGGLGEEERELALTRD